MSRCIITIYPDRLQLGVLASHGIRDVMVPEHCPGALSKTLVGTWKCQTVSWRKAMRLEVAVNELT